MIKKIITCTLVCLFLFPFTVHAECDYQRMAELSKIASNVQINFVYDVGEAGNPFFKVILSNLTSDIYVTDNNENVFLTNGEQSYGVEDGDNITYNIYSNDQNCYGEKILTKYLKIPYYNSYYNTDACKKNPDFKYCNLWDYVSVSSDEFNSELDKYVNSGVNNKGESLEEKRNDINYIIYIILGIIILFIITIIFIFLKKKRNKK